MYHRDFYPNIREHVATISERTADGRYTLELNLISWNGAPVKYDLRTWDNSVTPRKVLRGVTLTPTEAQILAEAIREHMDSQPIEDGDEL